MTNYIDRRQWAQLLAPIRPQRVSKKDGLSHVEAYEIRAHLNRVFGFARWSEDVVDLVMLYEQSKQEGGQDRWRAAYRATVRLTVCAPDGTTLATYTEAAVGTNFGWLPDSKRDETHDMAIKTAASQALKRCATNLGDQFGLSLYNKGSMVPLVNGSLVAPIESPAAATAPAGGEQQQQDVTAHITAPLAPEDPPAEQAEPQTSTPPTPATTPARQGNQDPDVVADLREQALAATRKPDLLRLLAEAGKHKVAGALTTDAAGKGLTLETLIMGRIKALR